MKRITKIVFIVVFFLTIVLGGLFLLNQPNDDILNNKLDYIAAIVMLAPILIVEFEIYSLFIYTLTKRKNKTITFLKIISLALALLLLCFLVFSFYTTTNKTQTILLVIFPLYVFSRLLLLTNQRKNQNSESH